METEIPEQRLAEKLPVEADGLGQDESVLSSSSQLAIEDTFEEQYPTGLTLIAILVPMVLVQFVIKLDMSIIATAIPRITNEFQSLLDVGWYGSAYQLASASVQPLTGKIYTNFKSKWAFFTFFFVFELGSLLCAVAQSSVMLIIARAIAGLGSAGLLTGGLTIVSACLPKPKQPAIMGIMIAIGQLGQACGPLVGGAFTQFVSWRWCFYVNLPIGGIIGGVLFFINIPDRIEKPETGALLNNFVSSMDLVGFAIFAPATIQFLLALQYGGNTYAWNSATIIGLFCGAGAVFALFIVWEYHKGADAMIPLSMLRQRIVWTSCATMFFNISVTNCSSYYLPVFFQAVLNASPLMSGVYLLPIILMQVLMAMISGILVQRLGFYLPWVIMGTSASAIAFGLMSLLTPTYPLASRVGYQILGGFGIGCATTMPLIAAQNLIPLPQIPVAMAILLFSQNFGGACFLTFAETVFSQSLRKSLRKYAPDANADAVLASGATNFRNFVSVKDLPGVLMAYSVSVDNVWYLVSGSAVVAFSFGCGMGWKDIRKKV